MQIMTLPLGELQTNCYVVYDEAGKAAVIDPACDADYILRRAAERNLNIESIFLTHGHYDHIGAVKELHKVLQCPVYLHEKDRALPAFLTRGNLFYTNAYSEGDEITVGSLCFRVLHTPGHTMGSVCLLCEEALFTGDTLFAGSCGRTDLGGSWFDIVHSLNRLAALPAELLVLPGHGESSTIGTERKENPYITQRSFE